MSGERARPLSRRCGRCWTGASCTLPRTSGSSWPGSRAAVAAQRSSRGLRQAARRWSSASPRPRRAPTWLAEIAPPGAPRTSRGFISWRGSLRSLSTDLPKCSGGPRRWRRSSSTRRAASPRPRRGSPTWTGGSPTLSVTLGAGGPWQAAWPRWSGSPLMGHLRGQSRENPNPRCTLVTPRVAAAGAAGAVLAEALRAYRLAA
mmetsp:Transcript_97128/g.290193  ORF Transcript_97128/g.290193 Transcript_97128/m.290193 type:complete len:203 (+) Transcript_97128:183-791(+)